MLTDGETKVLGAGPVPMSLPTPRATCTGLESTLGLPIERVMTSPFLDLSSLQVQRSCKDD